MIPQANQIYRHFKGNLYKVITIAVHTETEEELVIYQALYGDFKIYARPLSMFMSEVDKSKYPDAVQKRRFEPIEPMVGSIINAESSYEKQSKTAMELPGEKQSKVSAGLYDEKQNMASTEEKEQENIAIDSKEENTETKKEGTIASSDTSGNSGAETKEAAETEETVSIDPLLEAYLDTDSYRERLNILHGLQHRMTEHMLNTMAIVIDFELPEGDIETKYYALNDCLLTKEKYECNRIF